MTIYIESMETALAALRPETRQKMEDELEVALKDTKKEAVKHKHLIKQVASLALILGLSKKVSKEYEEISQG